MHRPGLPGLARWASSWIRSLLKLILQVTIFRLIGLGIDLIELLSFLGLSSLWCMILLNCCRVVF
jgi:hypothetical protein